MKCLTGVRSLPVGQWQVAVHEVVLDVTHLVVSCPQIFARHVRALLDSERIHQTPSTSSSPSSYVIEITQQTCIKNTIQVASKKGNVFPYSLHSVGPGADPGVQAVSPQVT